MDINIPEKVVKYESFLNDVLKEELKKIHITLDTLVTEIAEYGQLEGLITTMQSEKLSDDVFKTQVDLGCNFYMQANVDHPSRLLLNVGLGYYIDLTLGEALVVIRKRVNLLNKQLNILRKQSADTKAHIKLVLLGLKELQNLE